MFDVAPPLTLCGNLNRRKSNRDERIRTSGLLTPSYAVVENASVFAVRFYDAI